MMTLLQTDIACVVGRRRAIPDRIQVGRTELNPVPYSTSQRKLFISPLSFFQLFSYLTGGSVCTRIEAEGCDDRTLS